MNRRIVMRRTAMNIADRLVEFADAQPNVQAESSRASNRGLAGSAGLAMFFAGVVQVSDDPRYLAALQRHMKDAAQTRSADPGLFSGLCGLLVACDYAMIVEPRYVGLLRRIADQVSQISGIDDCRKSALSFGAYDIISGRAGEALAFGVTGFSDQARVACDYLVWLLEDETRWACFHPVQKHRGLVNDLGLAHGLAGMLTALTKSGPREASYDASIYSAAKALCERRGAHGAMGWPASIGVNGAQASRNAWCYGIPGCASAVLAASRRLGDSDFELIAIETVGELINSPIESWHISDFSVCHGLIGVALVLSSIAEQTRDSKIAFAATNLIERVLTCFDATSLLGYRVADDANRLVDEPGLLDGTAGIGLTLLTLAGLCDARWMQYFGLSSMTMSVVDF